MDGGAGDAVEDHRIRVGRERRERMRHRLLQSVLQVRSGKGGRNLAVIDDVIKDASVSRGTFYKYFDSLDQAESELALQMADEMTTGIMSVYDVLDDPVLRTATGFQLFPHTDSARTGMGGVHRPYRLVERRQPADREDSGRHPARY